MNKTPTTLIIMDGFGLRHETEGNAVAAAATPRLEQFFQEFAHTELSASGLDVGLPAGQMGNSEVGHTNIGAGRVVFQDLPRISKAIDDGSFFENPAYVRAMDACREHNSSLHLMGLLSDGGVHSHIEHLFALLDMAKALDWVRDNIASFGGDPQNITVLGFAAGGRDGMALLASPLFVGRFQKAISISGGMTCADENTSAETLAAALAPLAVQDGKALTEATARRWLLTEDPAVRSWLCGVDAARLAPLMANAGLRMSVFPHLYADGITLPEGGYPAAQYSEIPTLLLTGADEFNAAARWDSWFSSEEAKRFSADELEAAKQFAATYGSALCRVFSTRGSAEVIAARSDAPLYLGQIEYGSSASKTQIPLLGSFQGIALPMLSGSNPYFGWADLSGAGYQAMAEQLRAYLKNFITSGDPNGKKLLSGSTRWQRWTPDSPALLVLDADADHATAQCTAQTETKESLLAAMEADSTLSPALKQAVIKNVLKGRFFD